MNTSKMVVDSPMRIAFAVAHNTARGSKLKASVARKLRSNKGRIYSRGWKVLRGKS